MRQHPYSSSALDNLLEFHVMKTVTKITTGAALVVLACGAVAGQPADVGASAIGETEKNLLPDSPLVMPALDGKSIRPEARQRTELKSAIPSEPAQIEPIQPNKRPGRDPG
jgi:hypothetical protein